MDEALLDTDILTEILKGRNAIVRSHAQAYLNSHGQYAFSDFTQFEVLRGLRFKGAAVQLQSFAALCQGAIILPITNTVLNRAADLWVAGRSGGHSHRDADLIIAATSLESGRTLVTGNLAHFQWMAGLRLQDWRVP